VTPRAFGKCLDSLGYPHFQLWEHVLSQTLAALKEHDHHKQMWTTADEVIRRGEEVRNWFLDAIGGIPRCDEPVRATLRGVCEREKYKIEKLILETMPAVYVPALLYVPNDDTSAHPAVLFVSGHHLDAKAAPEYQRVCHDLVMNNFVVLAFDPTGQGERVSWYDPDAEQTPSFWGVWEHAYQGLQCVLTGTSIARYFLFDALRAIDYIQSRPEVNSDLIGITGNSGGGTQTTLVCMSGDPRIKAAVPCTYVTSREHYVQTGQPQDAEQIQYGMTKHFVDYDDMFLPYAPRPLLIGAVEDDFFNPEGTAYTFERLRHHYTLLGASKNVDCVLAPGQHKYCRELRQAAVNWFRVHLANEEPCFVSLDDKEIPTLPVAELWCTSRGSIKKEYPSVRTPYHLTLETIPKRRHKAPVNIRETVIDTLKIQRRLEKRTNLFPRVTNEQKYLDHTIFSVVFISEPGIWVSGCLVKPGKTSERVTVYLVEGGTTKIEEILAAINSELDSGESAFIFDPRGTGAVKCEEMSVYSGPFPNCLLDTTAWISWLAYCVGDCLLGMRVFDVLRAFEYLRTKERYKHIGLRAVGTEPALVGYLAAALDNQINPVRIEGLISSFEGIVRTERYRTDFLPPLMVHGVLHHFDLPELRDLFLHRQCEISTSTVSRCDL